MKKHLLTTLALCLYAATAMAQTNKYLFRTDSRSYVELTGNTIVQPAHFTSGDLVEIPMVGETLNLFGKAYPIDNVNYKISFSSTGHLRIDDPNDIIILDGLFYYMDSIDVNSTLSYKIEGSTGNKILSMQWKNLKVQSGPAGNFVNFQMKLYQATGIFEIHYGPSSSNNSSGYTTSSGPNIGLFTSPQDFSSMKEKIWVNGLPPNITLDSARNLVFNGIAGVPAEGTVYRFIPKMVATGVANTATEDKPFTILNNASTITVQATSALAEPVTVLLTGIDGKTVANQKMAKGSIRMSIPTTQLADGIYTITIHTAGKKLSYKTMISR